MFWIFAFVLFIVFLILKLQNKIDWSWWWVTSPLWMAVAIYFGVLLWAVVIVELTFMILY